MPLVPQAPGKLHAVRVFLTSHWLTSIFAAIAITAATLLLSAAGTDGAGNATAAQLPGIFQINNQGLSPAMAGLGDNPVCEGLDYNTYFGFPAFFLESNPNCPAENTSGAIISTTPNTYFVDPLGLLADLVVFTIVARLLFLLYKLARRRHKQFVTLSFVDQKKLERRRGLHWLIEPIVGTLVAGGLYLVVSHYLGSTDQYYGGAYNGPSTLNMFLTFVDATLLVAGAVLAVLVPFGIVIGILKLRRSKQPSAAMRNSDSGSQAQASKGWSWGAFLLTWIWGSVNNVAAAYKVFIPLYGIYWAFVLGAKGNSLAWEHGNWGSVDAFKKSRKRWAIWGGVFWLVLLLTIPAAYWGYNSWSSSVDNQINQNSSDSNSVDNQINQNPSGGIPWPVMPSNYTFIQKLDDPDGVSPYADYTTAASFAQVESDVKAICAKNNLEYTDVTSDTLPTGFQDVDCQNSTFTWSFNTSPADMLTQQEASDQTHITPVANSSKLYWVRASVYGTLNVD